MVLIMIKMTGKLAPNPNQKAAIATVVLVHSYPEPVSKKPSARGG